MGHSCAKDGRRSTLLEANDATAPGLFQVVAFSTTWALVAFSTLGRREAETFSANPALTRRSASALSGQSVSSPGENEPWAAEMDVRSLIFKGSPW